MRERDQIRPMKMQMREEKKGSTLFSPKFQQKKILRKGWAGG